MNSGRLRHRITIQTATEAQNNAGETIETWGTFAQRWAEVKAIKGDEMQQADKVAGRATHTVKIRYTDNVTIKMRILFSTQTFNIVAIRPDRTDEKFQILDCKENI